MRLVILAVAAAVGACAPYPPSQPYPPGPPPPPSENQCRAAEYQYLIGRNRSQIPVQPPGANWREELNWSARLNGAKVAPSLVLFPRPEKAATK